MFTRRHLIVSAAAATLAAAVPAHAQQSAQGPVRLLVGFAPGGAVDSFARALAITLRTSLNQNVIVENKAGAGQQLALNEVKRSKPDGLTLVLANNTPFTVYPHIYKKLDFDPVKDFTPLGRMATFEVCVAVGPGGPAGGIKEALAWAKANPDKAAYASPGAGTPGNLGGEMIRTATGIPFMQVPYKGGAPAVTDLVGGNVPFYVGPIYEPLGMTKTGKVRILATSGKERSATVPDVPTLRESGVDVVFDAYLGIYGPAGMAADQVDRISKALEEAMKSSELQKRAAQFAYRAAYASPAAVVRIQAEEFERTASLVKAIGITPE